MKKGIIILLVCISHFCMGQGNVEAQPNRVTLGFEQDILPYVLGGYILTGWTGRDKFRYRFSYAKAHTPKFTHQESTQSDVVQAFGMSFEYFFKDDFEGWWFGPGIGYWTNSIETINLAQGKNESVIFSLGGGYNYPLTHWLYVSPWIALHTRVSGNERIDMGNDTYLPSFITPELSIKVGIKLPAAKK